MNADGTGLTRLTRGLSDEAQPAWAPDGIHLVIASNRERDTYTGRGRYQVYVIDVDGMEPTRLMSSDASDFFPQVAPDASRMAFLTDREGQLEVYVADIDGSDPRSVTTGLPGGPRGNPAWSPDGRSIAFDTEIDGEYEIVTVAVESGDWEIVTSDLSGDHWYPGWAPGGDELAFGTFEGSGDALSHAIHTLDLTSRATRRITQPTPPGSRQWDYFGDWSNDGSDIVFATNRTGAWQLAVVGRDGSNERWVGGR